MAGPGREVGPVAGARGGPPGSRYSYMECALEPGDWGERRGEA